MDIWKGLENNLKTKGVSVSVSTILRSRFEALGNRVLTSVATPNDIIDEMNKAGHLISTKTAELFLETAKKTPYRSTPLSINIKDNLSTDGNFIHGMQAKIKVLDLSGNPTGEVFELPVDTNGKINFDLQQTLGDQEEGKKLDISIFSPDGTVLLGSLIGETVEHRDTVFELPVTLDTASFREILSVPFATWETETGKTIPSAVAGFFNNTTNFNTPIKTLQDVRNYPQIMEIAESAGLGANEFNFLKEIKTHATLQLISKNNKTNQILIERDFTSITSIARLSFHGFLGQTKDLLPKEEALILSGKAQALMEVGKNSLVEAMVAEANTFFTEGEPSSDEKGESQPCDCDCLSAVSPLAYLADLLDFVLREVTKGGDSLSLEDLEKTFYQSFTHMPKDCSSSETIVRQIRICIEVLRRNALAANKKLLEHKAIREYPTQTHKALLNAIGTSYKELRLLRGASDKERQRKADILGISVDKLGKLLLLEEGLTEATLEEVFGFQDTSRDPFSNGAKVYDEGDILRHWQLQGIEWGKNTDEGGFIYGNLSLNNNKYTLGFYKDENQQESIAEVTVNNEENEIVNFQLPPMSQSGLFGSCDLFHRVGSNDFKLSVIPKFLTWQLKQLQDIWKKEDSITLYPSHYSIVDPDLLTEDNFCYPLESNEAYSLWKARKEELAKIRKVIDLDNENERNISDMFKQVWSGNKQPKWDVFNKILKSNDVEEIKKTTEILKYDYHLTVESFAFLYEAYQQYQNSPPPPNTPTVPTDPEIETQKKLIREQQLDILLVAYKYRKLYFQGIPENWIKQESEKSIIISPKYFCLSKEQSLVDAISPVAQEQFSSWQDQLEKNSSTPVIDPDLLSVALIADQDVASIYDKRKKQLEVIQEYLHSLNSNSLSLQWFDAYLGGKGIHNTSNEAFLQGLGLEDINKLQDSIDAQKVTINPTRYGLTNQEFIHLLRHRKLLSDDSVGAETEDWESLFPMLIQIEKRRYIYPIWIDEESTAGDDKSKHIIISPEFFHSPEKIPVKTEALSLYSDSFVKWRRDPKTARTWLSKLKTRYQQRKALYEKLQGTINQVEAIVFPSLRDALIDVLYDNLDGTNREQNKVTATNSLLINTQENACRKVTRAAQAIESMQLLVWTILNGQLENSTFSLPDENKASFNSSWEWLESYGKWRSAVFAFLYPENILFPSLYQDKSLFFDVAQQIISGEIASTSNDESDFSNKNKVEKVSIILFDLLGDISPSSYKGIRKLIYFSLYERENLRSYIRPERPNRLRWSKNEETPNYSNVQFLSDAEPDLKAVDNNSLIAFPLVGYLEHFHLWGSDKIELEDTYLLPIHGALVLQRMGKFEDALKMYKWVYDFEKGEFRYPRVESLLDKRVGSAHHYNSWLNDPLNPHEIAKTRKDVDKRFIIHSIIRCLLDYAEAEFSSDTVESITRARELYYTASRLLKLSGITGDLETCDKKLQNLSIEVGEKYLDLIPINSMLKFVKSYPSRFSNIKGIIYYFEQLIKGEQGFTIEGLNKIVDKGYVSSGDFLKDMSDREFWGIEKGISDISEIIREGSGTIGFNSKYKIPGSIFNFCIPKNPVVKILHLRTIVGLAKLNNCLNLSGMHRELPTYSAPTDTSSGMLSINIIGKINLPQSIRLNSTPYRYKALIEQTKQLVNIAQQMESSYLSLLEKKDQENYSLLRARQDLQISTLGVDLQILKVSESKDQKELTDLQKLRVEFLESHYENLIDNGELIAEYSSYWLLIAAASIQSLGAIVGLIGGAVALGAASGGTGTALGAAIGSMGGALVSGGGGLSTLSSALSMQASYERRLQEWQHQKDLISQHDLLIVNKQISVAEDRYEISLQEKKISEINSDNSKNVINYLDNKFTNVELYHWMSGVTQQAYSYFLQQATVTAKLAQMQLAFERQQAGLNFILSDYWVAPQNNSSSYSTNKENKNRHGMTGSARLLQDIYKMDQHAFSTDQRKLQMSKTISLAMLDPIVFQQFRQSGSLLFNTTAELFDRDFPGHYLRLIKRVSISVIALIPPVQGIKATLSNIGISHVRISSDTASFENHNITRQPETIALTAATNDNGVFELQDKPEMMLPFEGIGVDTKWEFNLPKAANSFDFNTIADVLISIDYTALDSPIYRQEVIKGLDNTINSERPFSFRHQFADAWYDLHHPEQTQTPMSVSFSTRQEDFPPNISELNIEHVAMYFIHNPELVDPINLDLTFVETGDSTQHLGGAAVTNDSFVTGTRPEQGSATPWNNMMGKTPFGEWKLAFNDDEEIREIFEQNKIEDILFVITIKGQLPEWT